MLRSEIWLVNLDPTIGAEIHKTRPALIVSVNTVGILPLKVIVPITDWKDRYQVAPWMVRIEPDNLNGLSKISAADTFQVRSLAQQRFISRLGNVNDAIMQQILQGLIRVLGM